MSNQMLKTFFFLMIYLQFSVSISAQESMSTREIASLAKSAMGTIHSFNNGQETAFGSGFFIRQDGVLVTNLHVVQGADSISIEIENGEIYDNVYVLAIDERRDLIVLQIPVTGMTTLNVGDDRLAEVGDSIYVIGNPLGFQGTFSDGLISAKRLEDGVTYLQISAPISEGSSGGAVINNAGEVIAVTTLTIEEGQNLNLAIPARHAFNLLALAPDPVTFETIASELIDSSSSENIDRAAETQILLSELPEEIQANIKSMEAFQGQVATRVIHTVLNMREIGYESIELLEDEGTGTLEEGEFGKLEINLAVGDYVAFGVCDDDCTDLDIFLFNDSGELLERDVLDDADPVVEFTILKGGKYVIGTEMIKCAADNCIYAIDVSELKEF